MLFIFLGREKTKAGRGGRAKAEGGESALVRLFPKCWVHFLQVSVLSPCFECRVPDDTHSSGLKDNHSGNGVPVPVTRMHSFSVKPAPDGFALEPVLQGHSFWRQPYHAKENGRMNFRKNSLWFPLPKWLCFLQGCCSKLPCYPNQTSSPPLKEKQNGKNRCFWIADSLFFPIIPLC